MLDNYSRNIIYKALGPLYMNTLFIELVKFTPGSEGDEAVQVYPVYNHGGPVPRVRPPPSPRPFEPWGSPSLQMGTSLIGLNAYVSDPRIAHGYDGYMNRKRRADDDHVRMVDSPKRRAIEGHSPRGTVPPSPNYHHSSHAPVSPSLAMLMAPSTSPQVTPRMPYANNGPPPRATHNTLPPIRVNESPVFIHHSPPMRAMSPRQSHPSRNGALPPSREFLEHSPRR